jgi:predicted esterase
VTPRYLTVSRTARYFALGPEPGAAREIWIALHGYAQLAERFLTSLTPLDDGATHLVAPEALSRFYLETQQNGRHANRVGATWLTREARDADLQDHLHYLDRLQDHLLTDVASPPRLTVLGFSQGAVMAARWVARGRRPPDHTLLWGSPLPDDVSPTALARGLEGRPITLVAGDADPIVPPGAIEASGDLLCSAGLPARVIRFAGGHVIPRAALLQSAGRSLSG